MISLKINLKRDRSNNRTNPNYRIINDYRTRAHIHTHIHINFSQRKTFYANRSCCMPHATRKWMASLCQTEFPRLFQSWKKNFMLPVKLAILHARALYNVKKNKEAVHFSIGALIEAGISQMQIVRLRVYWVTRGRRSISAEISFWRRGRRTNIRVVACVPPSMVPRAQTFVLKASTDAARGPEWIPVCVYYMCVYIYFQLQ